MKLESFTPEELEVPTVEEAETMEQEPIVEELPGETVSELFNSAYNEALEGEELPDIAVEHMEGQRDMITSEAKEMEHPGILSRLSPGVKKGIIVGITTLSIMAGSMVKPEEAEAKKGFDWGNLKYNMSKFIIKDSVKEKIEAAKENEKRATTPAEKRKYRLQAEFWKQFGSESQKGLKEDRKEEVREEREKERKEIRKEREKERKKISKKREKEREKARAKREKKAEERRVKREADREARKG